MAHAFHAGGATGAGTGTRGAGMGIVLASGLAARLRTPGLVIHRELPFLWPKEARICLEGVMDLAIYDPEKSSWEVIDWKTNKSGGEELAEI